MGDSSVFDRDSYLKLNEVRKSMWISAAKSSIGGIVTACFGYNLNSVIFKKYYPKYYRPKYHNGKYLTFALLIMGSYGAFLGSVVTGKNEIQHIGHVFRRGAKPDSNYGKIVHENNMNDLQNMESSFMNRKKHLELVRESKNATGRLDGNSNGNNKFGKGF
jgi:hypothetical protein